MIISKMIGERSCLSKILTPSLPLPLPHTPMTSRPRDTCSFIVKAFQYCKPPLQMSGDILTPPTITTGLRVFRVKCRLKLRLLPPLLQQILPAALATELDTKHSSR